MSYRKSVFFARLKQRSPCLSGFCERGKRASQMLASRMPFTENASRAKTVLISEICVKKISVSSVFSVAKNYFLCGYMFSQKYQIMQNKPNFRNAKNTITLVYTMTNNNEQRTMNYLKQTQSNPILGSDVFTNDFCTERIEPLFDFFIAAVDMVNPVYDCGSLSRHCRQHKCRRGSQVGGHHGGCC